MEKIKIHIDTSDCPFAGLGDMVTIIPADPTHPFPLLISPRDAVSDSDTLKDESEVNSNS